MRRLTLALVLVVNLLAMPRDPFPGDPVAMREEARSLLLRGELAIDEEIAAGFGEPGQYFVRNTRDGRAYSKYGLVNSLSFVPALALERVITGDLPPADSPSRTLFLNLANVLLSVMLAWLLFELASLYTRSPVLRSAFVFLALYTGYLWNYVRVQSPELLQVVLMAGLFLCVMRAHRSLRDRGLPDERAIRIAWTCAGVLVLTRVSYVFLLPWLVFVLASIRADVGPRDRWAAIAFALRSSVLPVSLTVAGWALIAQIKFGSPFLSGYHQWAPDAHTPGLATDGLYGYLFSVQWSVFGHFPLAIAALPGLRRFQRSHAVDAVAIGTLFLLSVVLLGSLPSWRGEMCYGPRYLLFLAPLLGLPILPAAEHWIERWKIRRSAALALGAVAVFGMLSYSTFLQLQVNRFDFLAFYRARDPMVEGMPIGAAQYFVGTSYGRVNWDLSRNKESLGTLGWWAEASRESFPRPFVEAYERHIRSVFGEPPNYYWFGGGRVTPRRGAGGP